MQTRCLNISENILGSAVAYICFFAFNGFTYKIIVHLCKGNTRALLNSSWLNLNMHFGLCGRQEHMKMLWRVALLKTDAEGTEFVEFTNGQQKTQAAYLQVCDW